MIMFAILISRKISAFPVRSQIKLHNKSPYLLPVILSIHAMPITSQYDAGTPLLLKDFLST